MTRNLQLALNSPWEYSLCFAVWYFLAHLKKNTYFSLLDILSYYGCAGRSVTAMGVKQPGITSVPDEGGYSEYSNTTVYMNFFYSFFCFHATKNHICFSCGCQIMNRYLSQTFHKLPNVLDPQRILQLEKHMRSLEYFCLQG